MANLIIIPCRAIMFYPHRKIRLNINKIYTKTVVGLWGSLVSFQLRELETPVQIRADPFMSISEYLIFDWCMLYYDIRAKI